MNPRLLNSPTTFGIAFRDARKAKEWTQRELAERAGLSQAAISKLERRRGTISLTKVLRLVAMLELEVILQRRGKSTSKAPWE